MGLILTGVSCFVVGGFIGVMLMAVLIAGSNEDDIMGRDQYNDKN